MMHNPSRPVALLVLAALNRLSGHLAGLALLLMMLAGAADVIMTNLNLIGLPSKPVPATTEFIATMMVVTVFFGISLAQQRRAHIQLDMSRLVSPRLYQPLETLHHLCHAVFYGLLAVFGGMAAIHAFSVGEFSAGAYDFPVWPARVVLAAGSALMTLQCVADLVAVFNPRWRVARDDGRPADPPR